MLFGRKIMTHPESVKKRTNTGQMLERHKATTKARKELRKTEDKAEDKAYGFSDNIETSPFN